MPLDVTSTVDLLNPCLQLSHYWQPMGKLKLHKTSFSIRSCKFV